MRRGVGPGATTLDPMAGPVESANDGATCGGCGEPRVSLSEACPACGRVPPAAIEGDVPCRRCGYSLRGLDRGAVCPECGAPVSLSLTGDFLAAADPLHVRRLYRGALVVELSVYLGVLLNCVASPILVAVTGPAGSPAGAAAAGLARLGLEWLAILGWWWVSARDPGVVVLGRGERLRRTLRVFVVVSAVASLASASGTAMGLLTSDPALQAALPRAAVGVGFLAEVARFFAGASYIRVLAARIPSRDLDSTARTVVRLPLWILGLGVPIAVVTGLIGGAAWLLAMLAVAAMVIGMIVWFVWYCSMVSGLRDRLETVLARMPEVVGD